MSSAAASLWSSCEDRRFNFECKCQNTSAAGTRWRGRVCVCACVGVGGNVGGNGGGGQFSSKTNAPFCDHVVTAQWTIGDEGESFEHTHTHPTHTHTHHVFKQMTELRCMTVFYFLTLA